jgi:hypothetical protein
LSATSSGWVVRERHLVDRVDLVLAGFDPAALQQGPHGMAYQQQ